MKTKKLLSILLSGVLILSLAGCGAAKANGSNEENKVVKVGLVGENTEQWEPVIKSLAEEGITIELVTFSDYSQPNQALADKEIDINSFQHYAFLNKDIEDRNLDLSVIGETIIAPLGIYSNKIKSLDELK
ncbi:MAG: MetQ/NlpA family ABC transporter substrate-binding protein, partial [Clostridium sartagoforme]|nr:MetQ/NlpA family ABC transporter substrate-binding protein [Clostridium sartagoforme]